MQTALAKTTATGKLASTIFSQAIKIPFHSRSTAAVLLPIANPHQYTAAFPRNGVTPSMRQFTTSNTSKIIESIEPTRNQEPVLRGVAPTLTYAQWLTQMSVWAANPRHQKDGDRDQLQTALTRLKYAADEQKIRCDLSGLGITALADATFDQLGQLQVLNLEQNELSDLPASTYQLFELQELSLSDNQVCELPEVIGQLKKLRLLHLNRNQLSALPASFDQLNQLRSLHLNQNLFSETPPVIGQIPGLQFLNFRHNPLSPLDRSELRQLTHELCIACNC